jgi:hypothetical protein
MSGVPAKVDGYGSLTNGLMFSEAGSGPGDYSRVASVLDVATGDLLLVRFSPMNVQALLEDAEDSAEECITNDEPPVYSISTFGLVKAADVTVSDPLLRICSEAPVTGKKIWLNTGSAIDKIGFAAQLSEPPPHHYDVILGGSDSLLADVERLVKSFEPGQERNPAWKKRRS